MTQPLVRLAVERGRLLERISQQRRELRSNLQPLGEAARTVSRVLAGARRGADYLKEHPEIVATVVAVLVIARPQRVWRWSRRGFLIWRGWRLGREMVRAATQKTVRGGKVL